MYKDYFHFTHYPFHNTPNPDFYFNGPSHREALATMVYGVQEGKGFVLIIGDVGTGKTMLVQALRRELGDKYRLIEISHPWVSPEDVLSAICTRLGLSGVEREDPALMDILKQKLIEMDGAGQRVIVVIDEAHQLPERTLEGIRLLSNIETSARKLIQIVLLGQEELSVMLGQYSLRQLQQRIALSYHLTPLNEQETEAYILHRLRVAGGNSALFPRDCIALIYRESSGSPRVINQLCDNCLLIAYGKGIPAVDAATVREAIERMRPLSSPATPRWRRPEPDRPVAPPPEPPPLPFQLPPPPAERGWTPEYAPAGGNEAKGGGGRYVLYALVFGLALGAAGVWLSQNQPAELKQLWSASDRERRAPRAPSVTATDPQTAVSPREVAPPFPFVAERVTQASEVVVTEKESISLLASVQYGAWNDTVQDILSSANPQFANLDGLPPGTRIRLPRLSREEMLVQDNRGGFSVYYASFSHEQAARDALNSLKQVWDKAFLSNAERHGAPVFRIYVGSYHSRLEAETTARSLWFKYLPTIN
jgi:MSHA biogenesis protein MshM